MSIDDKIKKLREQGVEIYSYSKLSSFLNCNYEYYLTYVERRKGLDNCYGIGGITVHSNLESYYNGEQEKDSISENFLEKMNELEWLGISFPSDSIRENYINDILHFTKNFKPLSGRFLQEKRFLVKIGNVYMQGFIDMINFVDKLNKDGEKEGTLIDIIDWKTSSKFKTSELDDKGKQLLMYKVALEDEYKERGRDDIKINSVKWNMLKYVNISYIMKNKKVKTKTCSRRKWVKEMENPIKKAMLDSGMDDLIAEIELDEAINNNSIDNLPDEIKSLYTMEDCYMEYVVTDELVDDFKEYVNSTAKEIEVMDKNDKSQWKPLDLEKESFYCNNLCNHRESCEFLKEAKRKFASENGSKVSLDDDLDLL